MSAQVLSVSPLDRVINDNGSQSKLWVVEARDLARGFCGALFLALPLLYTVEMWERARIIPMWDMVVIVGVAYLGNVGFALFNGFKQQLSRKAAWFDALVAMGIGIVASAVTLVLVNRINFAVPFDTTVKLILLEMVPTSFGASLAMNQLGGGSGGSKKKQLEDNFSPDFKKVLATSLGAFMFSFNIAPTVETQLIGNSLVWGHMVGLILFSLVVSALMVFFAQFSERDGDSGILSSKWLETLFAYIVSLVISALLLWMFGYVDFGTPLTQLVPWVVTMGYATTLAGAAGRLVL